VADQAGVPSNFADVLINTDDQANLTDLNIAVESDSYLNVDVDSAPGGGTPAAFQNLNLSGAGGLVLRELFGQGETDFVTMVDATGLEGFLDLDLSDNDQNIDFDGGNGDTTLVTGDGDSDILTGAGDDAILVGSGDNTINTGAGNDIVDSGFPGVAGDNVIDTGEGDDLVYLDFGGDQTVSLGAGDDTVVAGDELDDLDAIEAGDGIDTLVVNVDHAEAFTANGDVDAVVNGFEVLGLEGTVAAGDSFTVNLDNIDDIDHVITDGTDAGFGSQNEIQTIDFNATGSQDGYVQISVLGQSIDVKVDANLNQFQVAAAVANAVQVAIGANQLPAGLIGAVQNGDNVDFEFDSALGNIGTSVSATDLTDTASLSTFSITPGTDSELEVATIDVISAAAATDDELQIEAMDPTVAFGDQFVDINGGSSIDEIGQQIVTQVNNNPNNLYTAAFNAVSNQVTFTAKQPGNLTDISVFDNGSGAPAPNTPVISGATVTNQGVSAAAETQVFTLLVNGSTAGTYGPDGGYLEFGNFAIEVPAGTDQDDLGALIVANKADIIAEDPTIDDIDYDTATGRLTVSYTTAAGNVSNAAFTNLFDGVANTTANPAGATTVQNGDTGTAAGNLTLNYVAAGGTLELADANLGTTNVVIDGAAAGANDDFNIVLATSADHTGVVDVTGVEALTVETQADGVASDLGLVANDVETLVVTGMAGVDFIDDFANLTSVDASALAIETDEEGVSVTTNAMDDATLTGSAGEDVFFSGSGDDVITGGTGNDEIHGRGGDDMIMGGEGDDALWGNAGADVLTGGAGNDTFHFTAVTDSQGTTVDTITDFVSGEDKLDFSAIAIGTGAYTGAANGYGAVLTSLVGDNTNSQAVLDTSTSTLYVDVNGDGNLDNQDMAIDLTGVAALDNNTDFTF
uniref:M10 family metallopeptidase C-terminal domain-containing protein n=1 Tax=Roseovarius sp. MMSF_3448 TaxID=3046713 RepID=UPI00273F020E